MSSEEPHVSESAAVRPRYCPRCRRPGTRSGSICPDCGEAFLDQHYCTICEDYWMLSQEQLCPKHDVELEAGPPKPLTVAADDETPALVTVGIFRETSSAEALRIRLEAEGIPTFLQGERMGGMAMYQVATGGVQVQVPARCADDARILISQTWKLPLPDDDLDDAWDDLAPAPGEHRRRVMKGFILLFLLGPFVTVLIGFLLFGR